MQSLIAGAGLAGSLALVAVTAVMLLGFGSLRPSLIPRLDLTLGLSLTAGFAALAIVRVNPVAAAFVALYIGLGGNYAAHYLFRYREMAAIHGATASSVLAAERIYCAPWC